MLQYGGLGVPAALIELKLFTNLKLMQKNMKKTKVNNANLVMPLQNLILCPSLESLLFMNSQGYI